MRHSRRRRLTRLAATGFALGIGATLGFTAPAGASAGEPPAYSANSSANLLHVSALDLHPVGIDLGPLLDFKVSTAGTTVDSTAMPRSEAAAAHLDLAVNKRLPDVPNASVSQTAPPDNPQPTVVNGQPLNVAGLAEVGLGHVLAHARWNEACEKGEPTQLTNSSVSLANLSLLPGANLNRSNVPADISTGPNPVVDLPSVGYAQSRSDIVDIENQDGNGVQAQSRISLAQLILFRGTPHQITIKVISPPTLTATAAGTENSSVEYSAPILEVTTADGTSQRLDDPHTTVDIPLASAPEVTPRSAPAESDDSASGSDNSDDVPNVPSQPVEDLVGGVLSGLTGQNSREGNAAGEGGASPATVQSASGQQPSLLRLSIGDLQKTLSPTHVKGEASSLRLQVLDVPNAGTLLDVALGQLKVEATVPQGGLTEPPVPSETAKEPNDGGEAGGKLPVTGTKIGTILGAGIALVIGGRLIMLFARRRAATPMA